MSKSKLLVVTRHSPLPENDGAGAYLFDLLSYLSAHGVQIEIVWIKAEGAFVNRGWWRVPSHISSVCRLQIVGSLAVGPYRFFWWGPIKAKTLGLIKRTLLATGLWRRPPAALVPYIEHVSPVPKSRDGPLVPSEPGWSELPSRNESSFFRGRLSRFRPDAVLANYCWLTPLFPEESGIQRLVLTHDVASHRLNLGNPTAILEFKELDPATCEGETRLLEKADVVLAISDDDAAAFRAMIPKKRIVVASKSAPVRSSGLSTISGRCLFVGGINPPNREGLAWLLERVWPIVRQSQPKASLHICGGICQTVSAPPEGVVLRGRVETLDKEYGEAEIVVVPLLQGTGIKIKLVEACSYGKACVTTPVGLQGLAFLRDSVIETIDSQSFADAVLSLLSNASLRQDLSKRCLTAVSTHLSPSHCYAELLNMLIREERLQNAKKRPRKRAGLKVENDARSLKT